MNALHAKSKRKGMGLFNKKSKTKTTGKSSSTTKTLESQSLVPIRRTKTCMRIATLDESLHASYYKDGVDPSSDSRGPVANEPSISFHKVCIREYVRVVGDNPSCSAGVPISIGWEYDPEPIEMMIDEYESSRPVRRTPTQMLLPRSVRESMLKKEWGAKQGDIAAAVRANIKVKNQRRRTVTNLSKNTEKVEERIENVSKKFKKSLSFGKLKDLSLDLGDDVESTMSEESQ